MSDMVERVASVAGITQEQARAAIEAMREPTEAMTYDTIPIIAQSKREMWRDMIDVALR